MTSLAEIREQYNERQYPGSSQQFRDLFGTATPDVKTISDWKSTWSGSDDNSVALTKLYTNQSLEASWDLIRQGRETCDQLGIAPAFYDSTYIAMPVSFDENGITAPAIGLRFYFAEHAALFKLAWRA